MKKVFYFLVVSVFLISCNSVKKTQQSINNGNYDNAIAVAVKHLRKNKTKKSNQSYILMLEDAYKKAMQKNKEDIAALKSSENPSNLEAIFNLYLDLKQRQDLIKPLLPLPVYKHKRNAVFKFYDYSNKIETVRSKLSKYLYNGSLQKLKTAKSKNDFRVVYDDLSYLNEINPNYKKTDSLLNVAKFNGTNFVYVSMQNESEKVIPISLEKDLLDFDTYGLDDFWTTYHNQKQANINYNSHLTISIIQINISPEQVYEKETVKEKRVKDGWKYLVDAHGDYIKDSLGNNIKETIYKKVTCKFKEITQTKSVQVVGTILYRNYTTNETVETYPLSSEFTFEHHFAICVGNKAALDNKSLNLLGDYIPFPSNEQMIYDTGQDLKRRIKKIILKHPFN